MNSKTHNKDQKMVFLSLTHERIDTDGSWYSKEYVEGVPTNTFTIKFHSNKLKKDIHLFETDKLRVLETLGIATITHSIQDMSSGLISIQERFREIEEDLDEEVSLQDYHRMCSEIERIFGRIWNIERPVIGMSPDGQMMFEWEGSPRAVLVVSTSLDATLLLLRRGKVIITLEIPDITDVDSQIELEWMVRRYGCNRMHRVYSGKERNSGPTLFGEHLRQEAGKDFRISVYSSKGST